MLIYSAKRNDSFYFIVYRGQLSLNAYKTDERECATIGKH